MPLALESFKTPLFYRHPGLIAFQKDFEGYQGLCRLPEQYRFPFLQILQDRAKVGGDTQVFWRIVESYIGDVDEMPSHHPLLRALNCVEEVNDRDAIYAIVAWIAKQKEIIVSESINAEA